MQAQGFSRLPARIPLGAAGRASSPDGVVGAVPLHGKALLATQVVAAQRAAPKHEALAAPAPPCCRLLPLPRAPCSGRGCLLLPAALFLVPAARRRRCGQWFSCPFAAGAACASAPRLPPRHPPPAPCSSGGSSTHQRQRQRSRYSHDLQGHARPQAKHLGRHAHWAARLGAGPRVNRRPGQVKVAPAADQLLGLLIRPPPIAHLGVVAPCSGERPGASRW